jgi:hypothetical protein
MDREGLKLEVRAAFSDISKPEFTVEAVVKAKRRVTGEA